MKKSLYKKCLVFGIILLFVGASIVPSVMSENTQKKPAVDTMSTTCYVDDSGDNSNGGTSWSDAWRDINFAINHPSVHDGDVILVGDGTYYENVVINKQLSIQGNGSDVPTIDGGRLGDVVSIDSDEVTISGFNIINSGYLRGAGIYSSTQSGVTIEKNVIQKNAHGIMLYECRPPFTIKLNKIVDNEAGIWLNGGYIITVGEHNHIENNSWFGIGLEGQYKDNVMSNEVKNNGLGILLVRSVNNEISTNNFISNGEGGANHLLAVNSFINSWNNNYYHPRKPYNGITNRPYIIWVLYNPRVIPYLFFPILIQFDWLAKKDPHDIPPYDP